MMAKVIDSLFRYIATYLNRIATGDITPTVKSGEQIVVGVGPYNGYITSAATAAIIAIPIPKQASGRRVTANKVAMIIRGGSGYIDDSYYTTNVGSSSEYTWSLTPSSNVVFVRIAKTSAMSSATNATPCSVEFRNNVTLTFS